MAKLYPPYIEGTIPAFYKTTDLDGTVRAELTVPFSMNKAVSKWEVKGFSLKLKNVFGDDSYLINTTTASDSNSRYYLDADYRVVFSLNENTLNKLTPGQFYKVQIAYISNDTIGYYSTVGIVKYTTQPDLEIAGLSTNIINMHRYSYVGKYSQAAYDYIEVENLLRQDYKPGVYYYFDAETGEYALDVGEVFRPPYFSKSPTLNIDRMKDATEKAYSYKFILTDYRGNVITDSDFLLHNSSTDLNSYESSDEFSFPSDLTHGKTYYIQYVVRTNNNLEVYSPRYRIMQKRSIRPEIYATVKAEMDYENGYIDVKLIGEQDKDGMEKGATGSFLLTRACSDDNYTVWQEVLRFGLHGQRPSKHLYKDFTVEQGKTYIYSLQQYNDTGLYSARIKSNSVYADFEDAFLFDGERQLKIKYNPKISSFKTGHLETKVDTIGSQFPFIFRNGSVAYKEFPLSGLISYQSDEKNLFMKDADMGLETSSILSKRPGSFRDDIETSNRYFEDLFNIAAGKPGAANSFEEIQTNYENRKKLKDNIDGIHQRTTSLVSYNILAERKFKLEVLDWLNNGKVKLFRSPTEGNYLVRLMNVSLSPEEKTGRMLHSFNSTAYEMAECTYENMGKYGIISIDDPQYKSLRWETVRLAEYNEKESDKRYERAFEYKKFDITEEHFEALKQEIKDEALLPYYIKEEGTNKYIQQKLDSVYNKEAKYFILSDGGVYVEEKVTQSQYNKKIQETLDSLYLELYRLEYNILGEEIYVKVKVADDFDYWMETWTEDTDTGLPVLGEPERFEDYYIRQTSGYLYYAKGGKNLLEAREVTSLRLTDMTPGDVFYLQLEGWGKPEVFTVGATGAYLVDTDVNIIYFGLPEGAHYAGSMTYSYYEDTVNLFNEIENVEITSVAGQQFIGNKGNILNLIENIRDTVIGFYYVNAYKRSIGTAYYDSIGGGLYRRFLNGEYKDLIGISIPPHTGENLDGIDREDLIEIGDDYFEDPFMLYQYTRDSYFSASAWSVDPKDPNKKIYNPFNFLYDPLNPKQLIVMQETYDRLVEQKASVSGIIVYSNNVYFDNKPMSIEDTKRFYAKSDDFLFKNLSCDVGVAIEVGYELQSMNYSIMRNDPVVAKYYQMYLEYKDVLDKAKSLKEVTTVKLNRIIAAQKGIGAIYQEFIAVLTEALRVWEAEQRL